MNIELIIFDIDDTLYNECDYVKSGFNAVSNYMKLKYDIDALEINKYLRETFQQYGRGRNFNLLIEKYHIDTSILVDLIDIYQNHIPVISLSTEVSQMLQKLTKKYSTAIITNGHPHVQRNKVKALDLEKYVDKLYYAEDEGYEFRKPHEKYFQKALRYFEISPKKTVMIGDDPVCDIQGAQDLGILTIHTNTNNFINDLTPLIS